ncbi:rab15 effector protein [Spea bombifrons]|uniref:rab15 effector protein n=1 Tax=Spea bombifrons TaxID=233779 RepID=UPI00234911C5|nr:rab15 effector protein [Spea bombifrons]
MGQTPSLPEIVIQPDKADIICEIFSQGVVRASQRLKEYLGFEDPFGNLRPSADTLTEIFLVNFINFCVEKGVEERISTSKMTKQQSLLLGVDWIWTLFGSDKTVKLQIAVQALEMSEFSAAGGRNGRSMANCSHCKEVQLTDTSYADKTPFEKLADFCGLVGTDCMGLFMVFGVPGKPKDIRGVLLESVMREKKKSSGEQALEQFILGTDTFLPTREMLETCMSRRNGQRNVGRVYINFL